MKEQYLIVFDLDGTLIDTVPANTELYLNILEKYEIPEKEAREYYLSSQGTPIGVQFETILKRFNKNYQPETIIEMVKEFEEKRANNNSPVFPDSAETLKKLKGDSYKIAISTTWFQSTLEEILRQVNLVKYIDLALGHLPANELYKNPNMVKGPGHYKIIKERFKIPPSHIMAVGDGSSDMQNALKEGVPIRIGRIGYTSSEQMKSYGATHIIKELTELPGIIHKLLK